jgi:hypothetical protein
MGLSLRRFAALPVGPLLAYVVLSTLFLPACTRTAALYNPPRVSFAPEEKTAVERAIVAGIAKRGWIPTREGPGVMLGTLHLRTHTAVVRIEYTEDSYQLTYLRSDNLNYAREKNGSEVIHRNYNAWVQNLVKDIDAQLFAAPASEVK